MVYCILYMYINTASVTKISTSRQVKNFNKFCTRISSRTLIKARIKHSRNINNKYMNH